MSEITKQDYEGVVESLGGNPTCLYASVEAAPAEDSPSEKATPVAGLRVVHIHAEGYEGPCYAGGMGQ